MTKSRFLFAITLLWFIALQPSFSMFQKELWPIWSANNPLSETVIDHSAWDKFLKQHVIVNDEIIHLLNYPAMTREDGLLLKTYLQSLQAIDIDNYNRDEQLAYWLNLYNALTVSIVLRYYPVDSIRDINISPGLFSIGPWGARLVKVNEVPLSLDDIHNRIIRPIWNDVRTHYAINNASLGAANLRREPYEGRRIDQQLNEAASIYINSKRGAQVVDSQLIVSKLYRWFAHDFGIDDGDIIQHLRFFAQKNLKTQLKHVKKISGYGYNWHLNTTPGP